MGCGTGISAAPPPSGLRFVTVVFCDISGSTQLALRFDPQVWHGILEAYFGAVRGALTAAGGRLEKFIGDAVVGVFGADAAGEDDAARAVEGALEALEQLAARNDEAIGRFGVRLSIRFGIASGRVVMADRDSSFAIGSVMNRAARLQSAAPTDGAVVDVRTWLLVRDRFACQPVDPVPAKGFDNPLQAWSVSRADQVRDQEAVFVNQADLLSRLRGAVAAGLGRPGVTTIGLEGEMGSGKSRVLGQLADSQMARVLRIRCGRDDGQSLWRLHQIARNLGDGSVAGAPSTAELVWRIRHRLAEVSRDQPLLVLVDGYEHAPRPLRDLIHSHHPAGGSVVFVLAGREVTEACGELLRVPALSDGHAYELLGALAGDVELHWAVPGEPLVRRSRGNPLFLEQLAALARDGSDDEVAPSAEAALGARIDRLSPAAQHVLACAGAWGSDTRPGDLDAVCELDEAGFSAALEELETQGLTRNRTATEVAYAHMVLGERARVHSAIAKRLREYARTEPDLLDLAVAHATRAQRHWHELDPGSAGDEAATLLAAQALVAAARRAIGRSEVRPAADFAKQARLLGVPDTALDLEIAALESYALGASGQVADALARIADSASIAGLTSNPSAIVHLRVNKLALSGASNGDLVEARALAHAAGDPGATARLDTWEGVQAGRAGDYLRAEALLRSAHAALRRAAGLGTAEIYGNLSLYLAYGDTPVPDALDRCLELRDEVAGAPILHAVVSCSAALLWQRHGDPAGAARMLDEARRVFTEMGHVAGQAGSLEFSSDVAELAGDLPAARDHALAAARQYAGAEAGAAAARCEMRAYTLDPEQAGPLSTLDGVEGWQDRVLRHQVTALWQGDRTALRAALDEIAAVRGRGARLVPLTSCLRVAAYLNDEEVASRVDALLRE